MNEHLQHEEILQANNQFSLKSIFIAFVWKHGLENILVSILIVVNSMADIFLTIPSKVDEAKRLKLVSIPLKQAIETWRNSQSWDANQLNKQLEMEEEDAKIKNATFRNQLGSLVEEIKNFQSKQKGANSYEFKRT